MYLTLNFLKLYNDIMVYYDIIIRAVETEREGRRECE